MCGVSREKQRRERRKGTHDMEQETWFSENPPEHEPWVKRIVYHDETFGFSELFRCKLPARDRKKKELIMKFEQI